MTFLYSIGLDAVAAVPREMLAEATIPKMPQTNIGRASLSIMLLLAIMSPIGIEVTTTLSTP